ncbi:hypothetical protein NMA58_24835 (plasmid) [Rhizobium sp. YTUHZ045]|uniref:hypothetical protein n=1 Tax=Rhizobium sp. YTUHZ045 TaxID=2962888 RepID=UPI003DAA097A
MTATRFAEVALTSPGFFWKAIVPRFRRSVRRADIGVCLGPALHRLEERDIHTTFAGEPPPRSAAAILEWRQAMNKSTDDEPVTKQINTEADQDNSLLPMLIWGLVMIVIGAIVVMMFV